MATEVKAHALPLDQIDTQHPIWAAFGDNGTEFSLVGLYNKATAKLAELASVRNAKSAAKASVDSSDSAEAVAYRALKEKADEAVKKITAEYQPQIDALIAARDAKKKTVNERVNEALAKAVEVQLGTVLADLDPEAKVREYKAITDQFNSVRTMLVTNGVDGIKNFRLPGAGVATGASGNGAGHKSGDGHAMGRPRFESASVDGTEIAEPTSQSITEAAGGNDVDNFKTVLLTSLGGNKESLPRNPATHTFEFNGHTVVVSGRAKKSAESE